MLKINKVRCSESGANSHRPVWMTGSNNCCTDTAESRVVLLMCRHGDVVLVAARQDVEWSVTSLLELLRAHECPYARVFHLALQLLPLIIGVEVLVYDVEGGTTMVLLTRIVFDFSSQDSLHVVLARLQVFKPSVLSLETLSSKVGKLVLFHFKLLCSHFLISNSEVLIKSFTLYHVKFHKNDNSTYLRRNGLRRGRGCARWPSRRTCGSHRCAPGVCSARSVHGPSWLRVQRGCEGQCRWIAKRRPYCSFNEFFLFKL